MTVENKGTSDFEKLVAEIGDVHKAMKDGAADTSKDDKKIDAAAEEGAEDADEDGDEDKPVVAKSFKLKLEDGSEVDATDGTELIKSLTERLEKNETAFSGVVTQLFDIVKSQGAQIEALRSAPKGRKAVVSVQEKKPAAAAGEDVNKSDGEMTASDFLAKSMAAYTAGKLTSHDVNVAETCINQGKQIPARIVRAVLA